MNKPEISLWEQESFVGGIDLLVIGAGIVGSSAALFWKEQHPGDRVVVVDKGLTPEGASTRNAGFACIGSVSEHLDDIANTSEEVVLARIRRRWEGLKRLRKTLGDEEIGYDACGGHEIFTDGQIFESCRQQTGRMNRHLEQITGQADVYTTVEYNGYPAIVNRLEGAIHTGRMMRALHRKLQLADIPVWWNLEATGASGDEVRFRGGHFLKAKQVLAATNGFTRRIADLPVAPARGMVLLTKPVGNLAWKGTFHHNKGYVYFRNFGDRLLIGGARDLDKQNENTDQFGINPRIKTWLTEFVDRTLKLPPGWEIEREWSGIMGFTPDKEPLLTRTASGLWVAAGLSGMGVAIGMETARVIVEQMND